MNQVQVDDRADAIAVDLLAELRTLGPRAIATRARLPAPVRAMRLPMPFLGMARIGYLTDVIYTRDMWIHRLDIARATRRPMVADGHHDGRILALMLRDLSENLTRQLNPRSVLLDLLGPAGGRYRVGVASQPAASIEIDALDFAWLAAGRTRPDDTTLGAVLGGDLELARLVIHNATVPV